MPSDYEDARGLLSVLLQQTSSGLLREYVNVLLNSLGGIKIYRFGSLTSASSRFSAENDLNADRSLCDSHNRAGIILGAVGATDNLIQNCSSVSIQGNLMKTKPGMTQDGL